MFFLNALRKMEIKESNILRRSTILVRFNGEQNLLIPPARRTHPPPSLGSPSPVPISVVLAAPIADCCSPAAHHMTHIASHPLRITDPLLRIAASHKMTSQPKQGDEMEVNPSVGQDVPTIESTAENVVPIAESEEGNHEKKKKKKKIATYFILAELPFRHVQDEGFQRFTRYFYPTFQFPSRVTVAKDIYQMYLAEKIKLKRELKKHRVSLTTDCWTSIQNIGYMCLTSHWISNDWTMQKRILSFIQVPSHKGEILGKELIACLHDWGIDKVFCVTVDNVSSNDVALKKLKSYLQEKKRGLVLDGEMLHMRCCAHILNLVVCDDLKEISQAISCIQNAVRYPRSSTTRLKRFKESYKEANIESQALLCLDVSTRWNSTFLM
ncbi:hypothetical protein UlMin_034880 [Ulmus minor]